MLLRVSFTGKQSTAIWCSAESAFTAKKQLPRQEGEDDSLDLGNISLPCFWLWQAQFCNRTLPSKFPKSWLVSFQPQRVGYDLAGCVGGTGSVTCSSGPAVSLPAGDPRQWHCCLSPKVTLLAAVLSPRAGGAALTSSLGGREPLARGLSWHKMEVSLLCCYSFTLQVDPNRHLLVCHTEGNLTCS